MKSSVGASMPGFGAFTPRVTGSGGGGPTPGGTVAWGPQFGEVLPAFNATKYDGTAFFARRVGGLTGAADGSALVLAMAFTPRDSAAMTLFHGTETLGGSSLEVLVQVTSANEISVRAENTSGVATVSHSTINAPVLRDRQNTLVWVVDLRVSGDTRSAIVVNGSVSGFVTASAATLDFTLADWAIGAFANGGSKLTGDIGPVFFDLIYDGDGKDIDRITQFVVGRRFRDFGADGSNVFGSPPLVYFNSDPATNLGTGGNFTNQAAHTAADRALRGYPDPLAINLLTTMPTLGLSHSKTIGVSHTMPLLALSHSKTISVAHALPTLGLSHGKTVGVNHTMPSLATNWAERQIGVAHTMPSLALSHNKTIGIHLSGSVVGAPFWQSAETATGTTSIVVTKPANTQVGNLLLAFIGAQESAGAPASISAPAGWTQIENNTISGMRATSFYRVADGTEGATLTFTVTPTIAVLRGVGEVHRVIAVDTGDPIDVSAAATLSAASLDPDPDSPTVTTTVDNTLVFAFLLHDHLALTQTHTPGASHDERTDFQHSAGEAFLGAHSQTRVFATPAATGTIDHNCTETVATDALMHRIAIAPGPLEIAP